VVTVEALDRGHGEPGITRKSGRRYPAGTPGTSPLPEKTAAGQILIHENVVFADNNSSIR
jgi:hypothetical protein